MFQSNSLWNVLCDKRGVQHYGLSDDVHKSFLQNLQKNSASKFFVSMKIMTKHCWGNFRDILYKKRSNLLTYSPNERCVEQGKQSDWDCRRRCIVIGYEIRCSDSHGLGHRNRRALLLVGARSLRWSVASITHGWARLDHTSRPRSAGLAFAIPPRRRTTHIYSGRST